jgi:hypothetical protein
MSAAPDLLAKIMGERANVGAFGAGDAELGDGFGVGGEGEGINVDEPFLPFNLDAFAGKLVEGDTVDLDGGDHGWELHEIPDEGLGELIEIIEREGRHGQRAGEFAIGIVTGSGLAEFECAFVNFIIGHELLRELGSTAEDDDQQTRGVGIEGAAVADLVDFEMATDACDDIVGSGADRFVHEDGAVEGIECLHQGGWGKALGFVVRSMENLQEASPTRPGLTECDCHARWIHRGRSGGEESISERRHGRRDSGDGRVRG